MADHLYTDYRLAGLVIGYDFALGRGRQGTREMLTALGVAHGFVVESVEASRAGSSPISSTRIREALGSGRVEEAAELLGRDYAVTGRVVPGDGRGGGLGFPTANLEVPPEKLLPAPGVYAGRIDGPGLEGYPAAVNLGRRPTFAGNGLRLEAHLPGFQGELTGATLTLSLERRLRDEVKFNDINELKRQIGKDVEAVTRGKGPLRGEQESG
jgi:riboflavin kinase/FMN adenylyltransferase